MHRGHRGELVGARTARQGVRVGSEHRSGIEIPLEHPRWCQRVPHVHKKGDRRDTDQRVAETYKPVVTAGDVGTRQNCEGQREVNQVVPVGHFEERVERNDRLNTGLDIEAQGPLHFTNRGGVLEGIAYAP